TTLVKQIISSHPDSKYINCELGQNQDALETTNTDLLISYLGKKTTIAVLDEAQHIRNIGLVLKVLRDTFPSLQLIVTGSSGFDLLNKITEPLTGRSRLFHLYSLSFEEVLQVKDILILKSSPESIMRFGLYPEVFGRSDEDAAEELNNLSVNYLYKDILMFENLRRSDLIRDLVKALALQLGNEVSLNNLANMLGENVHTVKKYIELLEKTYIIFRLSSFSRNLRNEIGKGMKVYFYDLGIRNSIIRNFNPMDLRTDTGGLWENFFILERMKYNNNHRKMVNAYFWRTYQKEEIDLIEESQGKLTAYECKYNFKKKILFPKTFRDSYPGCEMEIINPDTFWKYLL
ncbi:MAG: ATP-binding protein, partial [Bacteroidales bacterium]|nr:ATP-binding protein [Bacteroidales bacterium]